MAKKAKRVKAAKGRISRARIPANDHERIAPDAIDATPERFTKGDIAEAVNPALMDSAKHGNMLVRRFKATHLDRLYRKDDPARSRFTDRQYAAGDWYRNTHSRCSFALSVVSSYGERTSASEPSYGLPRTEAQVRARRMWLEARRQFPTMMVGFLDRFLVHDDLPRYGGNQLMRSVREIGQALDGLADWLKYPR